MSVVAVQIYDDINEVNVVWSEHFPQFMLTVRVQM